MKTSEVLYRAADLIEERGWEKGDGWPTAGRAEDAPLCVEGGIAAAMGMRFGTSIGDHDRDQITACPAYVAVDAYLGDALVNDSERRTALWWWNDRYAKTADRVVEVLRAAAVIEAAKENPTAAPATPAPGDTREAAAK